MSARATLIAVLGAAKGRAAARARCMVLDEHGSGPEAKVSAVRRLVAASDTDALFVGACVAAILMMADSEPLDEPEASR